MQINKDARAGTKQRDTRTDSRTQPDMDPHTSAVTDTETETHRETHRQNSSVGRGIPPSSDAVAAHAGDPELT